MIYTQTIRDLGHPPWVPKGAIVIDLEGPTQEGGYGMGYQSCLDAAVTKLKEEYSDHAVLVNAEIKFSPGSGHDCYGRYHVRIVGDLYLRQV